MNFNINNEYIEFFGVKEIDMSRQDTGLLIVYCEDKKVICLLSSFEISCIDGEKGYLLIKYKNIFRINIGDNQ